MSSVCGDDFTFNLKDSPTPELNRDESFGWAWGGAAAFIDSNTEHIERSCNLPNLGVSLFSDAQGSLLHGWDKSQASGLMMEDGQGSALQMESETLDRPDSMQIGPERVRVENGDTSEEVLICLKPRDQDLWVENGDTSEEVLNFLKPRDQGLSSQETLSPLLAAAPRDDHRAPIVDNRGKHWRQKVAEGKPPVSSKGNEEWARRRQAKEAEFAASMHHHQLPASLPWKLSQGRACGNIQKVMYMDLCMHEASGAVQRVERREVSEGLFGIVRFVVPEEGRPAFDAGLVPSTARVREQVGGKRANAQVRRWETAGFRERPRGGAELEYVYDPAVYAKQKAQQRHRSAA